MVDSTVRLPQYTTGYYIQLLNSVETARANLPPESENGLMAEVSAVCFYRHCRIPKNLLCWPMPTLIGGFFCDFTVKFN